MTRYAGIFIVAGAVRRLRFEAASPEEANELALKWGVGVEGEAADTSTVAAAQPEAYDLPTARRVLGNVSRSTIYRWLLLGELERLPSIGKVLITRQSIERRAGRS